MQEVKMIPAEDYRKVLATMPVLCMDCIVVHKGKYLLVKRKNRPLKGEYWLPGGRVYKNETLEQAAIRKMKEEIGLDVKIIKLAGFHEFLYEENEFGLDSVHTVSAIFYVSPISNEVTLDEQSDDYVWSDTLPDKLNLMI